MMGISEAAPGCESGFYYVIEVDEETGLETVKRYKILNWERVKSEI
jgi:hypothetical protein